MGITQEDLKRMGLKETKSGTFKKDSKPKLVSDVIKKEVPKEIYIPYEVMSSKNSKAIEWIFKPMGGRVSAFMMTKKGRKAVTPLIRESKQCKEYRKMTENYYKAYRGQFHQMIEGKSKPYIVEFTFVRKTKRKFDFHNMVQLPCDLMQEYGWVEEDDINNLLVVPPLPPKEPYKVSKTGYGVIIRVL